jgi:hypothetical protein
MTGTGCRGASMPVVALSLLACACNGVSDAVTSGRPAPPDAAAAKPSCPQQPPGPETPCHWPDVVCEYGDDPRRVCRLYVTCALSGGQLLWNHGQMRCPALPATTCPPTFYQAEGKTCPVLWTYCGYGDLACGCGNCRWYDGLHVRCDGEGTWHCDTPNIQPGCPAGAPRAGSPCAPDGHRCEYGCGPGVARECVLGLWLPRDGHPCPIP